jgi:hypothetical protein
MEPFILFRGLSNLKEIASRKKMQPKISRTNVLDPGYELKPQSVDF